MALRTRLFEDGSVAPVDFRWSICQAVRVSFEVTRRDVEEGMSVWCKQVHWQGKARSSRDVSELSVSE